MPTVSPITFRAYLSPRPGGRLLVTVLSPLLAAPLYRSYPADMGEAAAVARAVGHALALCGHVGSQCPHSAEKCADGERQPGQRLVAVEGDVEDATQHVRPRRVRVTWQAVLWEW